MTAISGSATPIRAQGGPCAPSIRRRPNRRRIPPSTTIRFGPRRRCHRLHPRWRCRLLPACAATPRSAIRSRRFRFPPTDCRKPDPSARCPGRAQRACRTLGTSAAVGGGGRSPASRGVADIARGRERWGPVERRNRAGGSTCSCHRWPGRPHRAHIRIRERCVSRSHQFANCRRPWWGETRRALHRASRPRG